MRFLHNKAQGPLFFWGLQVQPVSARVLGRSQVRRLTDVAEGFGPELEAPGTASGERRPQSMDAKIIGRVTNHDRHSDRSARVAAAVPQLPPWQQWVPVGADGSFCIPVSRGSHVNMVAYASGELSTRAPLTYGQLHVSDSVVDLGDVRK